MSLRGPLPDAERRRAYAPNAPTTDASVRLKAVLEAGARHVAPTSAIVPTKNALMPDALRAVPTAGWETLWGALDNGRADVLRRAAAPVAPENRPYADFPRGGFADNDPVYSPPEHMRAMENVHYERNDKIAISYKMMEWVDEVYTAPNRRYGAREVYVREYKGFETFKGSKWTFKEMPEGQPNLLFEIELENEDVIELHWEFDNERLDKRTASLVGYSYHVRNGEDEYDVPVYFDGVKFEYDKESGSYKCPEFEELDGNWLVWFIVQGFRRILDLVVADRWRWLGRFMDGLFVINVINRISNKLTERRILREEQEERDRIVGPLEPPDGNYRKWEEAYRTLRSGIVYRQWNVRVPGVWGRIAQKRRQRERNRLRD